MSDQASSAELTGPAGTAEGGTGEPQPGRGQGRRAVMLGAAAVGAGAVASVAVPAGATTAAPTQPAGSFSVVVAANSTINLKEITGLVARIGGMVGCRTCGLIGIDLRLIGVDPAEIKDAKILEGLPGVGSAVVF